MKNKLILLFIISQMTLIYNMASFRKTNVPVASEMHLTEAWEKVVNVWVVNKSTETVLFQYPKDDSPKNHPSIHSHGLTACTLPPGASLHISRDDYNAGPPLLSIICVGAMYTLTQPGSYKLTISTAPPMLNPEWLPQEVTKVRLGPNDAQ